MAAALCDLLRERHITLSLKAGTRDEALRAIIATLRDEAPLADLKTFFDQVVAREQLRSTYMGNGVAIPHARTDLIAKIILGVGRSREGVVFGPAGERAHLIFLVAVPQRMVNHYLVCVGALARVVNDPKTRAALMNSETEAEFLELIRAGSLLLE